MIGRNVDTEAQELLGKLRDMRLCAKLPESNITRFSIPWIGKEGLDAGMMHYDANLSCKIFLNNSLFIVDRIAYL